MRVNLEKTAWNRPSDLYIYICPICKLERRSRYFPSPRVRNYLQLALCWVVFSLGSYSRWGVKGIFAFVPILVFFEWAYRVKARQAIPCQACGFDPYLYKWDPLLARDKVKERFQTRRPP